MTIVHLCWTYIFWRLFNSHRHSFFSEPNASNVMELCQECNMETRKQISQQTLTTCHPQPANTTLQYFWITSSSQLSLLVHLIYRVLFFLTCQNWSSIKSFQIKISRSSLLHIVVWSLRFCYIPFFWLWGTWSFCSILSNKNAQIEKVTNITSEKHTL